MRSISVLGSTGSIGRQTLQVIALHPDRFQACALTAKTNFYLLCEQVRCFRPVLAVLEEPPKEEIPEDVRFCRWEFGREGMLHAAMLEEAQDVLVAVSGFAGLALSLAAADAGKRLLLANKESLVAGGALLKSRLHTPLLPVDSEHSAIFQCLRGAEGNPAKRLILTASGGPFRTWDAEKIRKASVREALNHPNWSMGRKITVDSASMLNKALEIIEAHWLYDMPGEKIDVLIHPQSIVHSMVEFEDGAVMAQLGVPDMRLPILYAMSFPERLDTGASRLDLTLKPLTFEQPDRERFPGMFLAYEALKMGGTAGTVLNAANEVAVEAFFEEKICFGDIARVTEETMMRPMPGSDDSIEGIQEADRASRAYAREIITRI